MKPIKSMKYHFFKNLPPLHLLFTEEDNVIVVRCLDFSISSHGQTIPEAVESINSSLMEYVNHGLENKNVKDLFDPDLKEYWDLYMTLEIEEEKQKFKENLTEDAARILHEGLAYA